MVALGQNREHTRMLVFFSLSFRVKSQVRADINIPLRLFMPFVNLNNSILLIDGLLNPHQVSSTSPMQAGHSASAARMALSRRTVDIETS